jgi:cyclopropane fatty-acyl-phospholipid synthase-like methyltransferase
MSAMEPRSGAGDRQFSPSAARNREPIAAVFRARMPEAGTLLEIASGSGEHVVHLAAALPGARFLPGDPDPAARASIAAWTRHSGLSNISAPHEIDVTHQAWEKAVSEPLAAVFSINMIHIAPFAATAGLFRGAARLLASGAKLFLYGPFSRNGAHTAPSNAAFDESLKARNPLWGVRDLEREVRPAAEERGFALDAAVPMPANNFSAIFVRV